MTQDSEISQPIPEQADPSSVTIAQWQAPFPPPDTLKAFDGVIENGAERIFKQFELESEHQRQLELKLVEAQIWNQIRGQIYAFVFAMLALFVSVIAIYQDQPWVAALFGGGVIASVVAAFLRQGRDEKED